MQFTLLVWPTIVAKIFAAYTVPASFMNERLPS